MALARSKAVAVKAVTIVDTDTAPLPVPWSARRSGSALPLARPVHDTPLRRCTFRRLTVTNGRGSTASYSAECLYEGPDQPAAMGDLDRAWSVCEGCTRSGIFRADED